MRSTASVFHYRLFPTLLLCPSRFRRSKPASERCTRETTIELSPPPKLARKQSSMLVTRGNVLKAFSNTGGRWAVVTLFVVALYVWLSTNVKTFAGGEGSVPVMVGPENTAEPNGEKQESSSGDKEIPAKIKMLSTIDATLVPSEVQEEETGRGRRLIFIGDIHGCYDELMSLLEKVEYNKAQDHIITTGDMVNKGPASAAVLDFLIANQASCVRGNHDDHILSKVAQLENLNNEQANSEDPGVRLAASLTKAQVQYLESCPIILDLGEMPVHGRFTVVHGGLVPSLELRDQDPWAVMNMRIVHQVTHVPSKKHSDEHHVRWADLWNNEQVAQTTDHDPPPIDVKGMLPVHRGMTIVYGHDARQGLQMKGFTKGLDSGCVRGGELTALVLSGKPGQEIVQVKCNQYA